MALDPETVQHIARLARIHIGANEVARYATELSSILEFVEQMNAVDTSEVKPLSHPEDRSLRMRVDEVTEQDQRQAFQQVAPSVETGLYLVPKVIE